MSGRIKPKGSFYLRVHVGKGDQGDKHYEMSFINGNIPAIESKQTGKFFVLSWNDILDMAVQGGIDNED